MSEVTLPADPTTRPFWEAATEHRLLVQRCSGCGRHQFYPRPFCLACGAGSPEWVEAAGTGVLYSQTTVHVPVIPELEPPYRVGIVQLDEGPRLTAGVVGPPTSIGDRLRLGWRERDGAPPVPVFEAAR